MNAAEKSSLKKLFVQTALYFREELPDIVLALYVADLEDLPFKAVERAMNELRRDPKTRRCPIPSQVRDKLVPNQGANDLAVDAVSRIVESVSRFGPYMPETARSYIGPLGWEVVKREGGWQKLCEALTNENLGVMRAQWREIAKAVHGGGKLSEHDQISEKTSRSALESLGNFLPKMPEA